MFRRVITLAALGTCSPSLAQEYQVGSGDTVSIQVFDEPRLSRVSLVPPRCSVDVELIGAVDICGRTTAEIATEVRSKFAEGYLVNPNVIVEVTTYGSQKVEIRGAVKQPGIQVLAGPTALSQIITTAGGPDGDNVVDVEVVSQSGHAVTYALSSLSVDEAVVLVSAGDTVILRQGRHVYVDGEVKSEGQVPYHEGLTVSQAISLAGGPGKYASQRRVFVLTQGGERIVVNLQRVRDGRDADVVLKPDERVTLLHSYL